MRDSLSRDKTVLAASAAVGRCEEWVKRECQLAGIALPPRGASRRKRPTQKQTDQIKKWQKSGVMLHEVAERLGISKDGIRRHLHGLGIRDLFGHGGSRPGERHQDWKGGRVVDKSGYILIYSPEHPNASGSRGGRYVREHRLVMEKHLGRYLKRGEVVHHLNGKRDDNRIDNLELFGSNAAHLKHELTGKCPKWTKAGKENMRLGHQRWIATRKALQQGAQRKR